MTMPPSRASRAPRPRPLLFVMHLTLTGWVALTSHTAAQQPPHPPTLGAGATPEAASDVTADARSTAPKGAPAPEHTLWFVMNASASTADLGVLADGTATPLGVLYDTNVARFTPGLDTSAAKVHSTPELTVLVGDLDDDGIYWESLGEDIDALAVQRFAHDPGPIGLADLLLSTETDVGFTLPDIGLDHWGALDGSIFRLRRASDGSGPRFEIFLSEQLVIVAIGQFLDPEADVDIDAFAQSEDGTLFFSFRLDQVVNGVLVEDDGVVAIPAESLTFGMNGRIDGVAPFSAVVVLDKAATDDMVAQAGLQLATGTSIGTLGDLQALDIDPAGGTFVPVQPLPGHPSGCPNLLFNGQRLGATILSTRDGGRIAELNGRPLGASVVHGGPLGLHPHLTQAATHDLNGLVWSARQPPALVADVLHGEVDLSVAGAPAVFYLGNFEPGGVAWLLVGAFFPGQGGGIPSVPAGDGAFHPDLYLPTPWITLPVPIDAKGRARIEVPAGAPPAHLWIVIQAWEVGSGRLSPPAGVWIWK